MKRSNQKTPLVFIHGIKGSVLKNALSKTQWVRMRHVLGLSTPDLRLSTPLTATHILKEIPLLPGFPLKTVYGPWVKTLTTLNRPTFTFPYDWRQDNHRTLLLFKSYLQKIVESLGSIQVVAHSMGGLITLALAKDHPDWFQSILLAGVPIRGGLGFLPDLHHGVATGFNRRILSPNVLWTFPSVFSLFPLATSSDSFVLNSKAQKVPIDFFNADHWKVHRLGPWRSQTFHGLDEKTFSESLLSAKSFRQKVEVAFAQNQPPLVHLMGDQTPTLQTLMVPEFKIHSKALGDGRILPTQGLSPSFEIRVERVSENHSDLLNSRKLTGILDSLL